jgi:hypothetical protein
VVRPLPDDGAGFPAAAAELEQRIRLAKVDYGSPSRSWPHASASAASRRWPCSQRPREIARQTRALDLGTLETLAGSRIAGDLTFLGGCAVNEVFPPASRRPP